MLINLFKITNQEVADQRFEFRKIRFSPAVKLPLE